MTNCEYCDYYKETNNMSMDNEKISACLFTDFIFTADPEKTDTGYPCRDVSYQDYLGRNKKKAFSCQNGFKNDDWKLTYKSKHPVAERNRSKAAV